LEEAELELEGLDELIAEADKLAKELATAYSEARVEYNVVMNDNRALLEKCSPQRSIQEIIAINQAVVALRDWDIAIAALRAAVGLLMALLATAENEKGNLELFALGAQEHNREAWCADLTEDAEVGDLVATIEIPGEPGQILIAPAARQPATVDGKLMMRGAMNSAQVAWNWAVLPGWQKWKPTCRVGTLTDKDDDMNMGTVAFDVARSTATGIPRATRDNAAWKMGGDPAGLPVNQADPGWIEFEYMECDSWAFAVGDRVVVEFRGQDWSSPMIIGFESHPKECKKNLLTGVLMDSVISRHQTNRYDYYDQYEGVKIDDGTDRWLFRGGQKWYIQQWSSIAYSVISPANEYRTGSISFENEGWIDIGCYDDFSGQVHFIGSRAPRATVNYEWKYNDVTSQPEQYIDGVLQTIPDSYKSLDRGKSYDTTIDLPQRRLPLSDPRVAQAVALLGIPGTYSNPNFPEVLPGPLRGLQASWYGVGVYLYAFYKLKDTRT
jgi:hypothetical protein